MPRFTPMFKLKDKMARTGVRIPALVKATGYSYQYISRVINGHENGGPAKDAIIRAIRKLAGVGL